MEQETDEQLVARIVKQFRELRDKIFKILPNDCWLRAHGQLARTVIAMINPAMLDKKLLGREDICLFCTMKYCPWNDKVSHRLLRYIKVWLLAKFFCSSFQSFFNNISAKETH